jgi:hypothetical protein
MPPMILWVKNDVNLNYSPIIYSLPPFFGLLYGLMLSGAHLSDSYHYPILKGNEKSEVLKYKVDP